MPRLFAALEVPPDISSYLYMLRGGLHGAKWIEHENYHITLRFIGDVDGRETEEIAHAFSKISHQEFVLHLSGLDVFGGKKPRALYAAISMNQQLRELQAEQERILQRLGLRPDRRKFTPHITLARLNGTKPIEAANYLSSRGGIFVRPFEVSRFVLFSSRSSRGGGPYLLEESYDLTRPPARKAEFAALA